MVKADIDVIMPVSRTGNSLKKSIKSVFDSTNINTRLIVVDNTKDGFSKIKDLLRSHDVYVRQPNQGYAAAMNAPLEQGVEFSDFIGYVNDDDYILPEKFYMQLNQMDYDQTELSITEIGKMRLGIPIFSNYGVIPYKYWNPLALIFGFYGADATLVTRKNWLLNSGLRREDIHSDLADFEYLVRNICPNQMTSISRRLYKYVQHKNQISKNRATPADYLSITDSVEKYLETMSLTGMDFNTFCALRPMSFPDSYALTLDQLVRITGTIEAVCRSNEERKTYMRLLEIRLQCSKKTLSGQFLMKYHSLNTQISRTLKD